MILTYKKYMKKRVFLFLLAVASATGLFGNSPKKHEMRAVWIATVAGIDWPSQKKDAELQKTEMVEMLDSLRAVGINAVVFQVRPTSDAFYQSDMEPWSHYLTGEQGRAPEPYYDPLKFVTEEAHKRCMEVHAWINPYRVTNGENTKMLNKGHIYYKRPELFLKYGGKIYFNPGLQEVRDYLTVVVSDIVRSYDIDAVHLDDYFYPYKVAGAEFPDDATFRSCSRGIFDKEEWRRDNVNLIVEQIHKAVKEAKPWVEFGISPFGVWRNSADDLRGSDTRAGCTNYDELYADVLLWLERGWIDYVTPQLYWEIGKDVADYEELSNWWGAYSFGRNYYIGLYASGFEVNKTEPWKRPNELVRQMDFSSACEEVKGYFFYSAKPFLKNPQGLCDSLRKGSFRYPALVPLNEAIEGGPSISPENLHVKKGSDRFTDILRWDRVQETGGYEVAYYVIYAFKDGEAVDFDNPENIVRKTRVPVMNLTNLTEEGNYKFAVTAVNRFKHESAPSNFVEYEVR